jgi:hypothetical protein
MLQTNKTTVKQRLEVFALKTAILSLVFFIKTTANKEKIVSNQR